jgi:hypothetical protein
MNFESIMLIEWSQSQKDAYCMIPLKWNSRQGKSIKWKQTGVSLGVWVQNKVKFK